MSIPQMISLMDLTSLDHSDTKETIGALLQQGLRNGVAVVAAVCVYPEFVELCKQQGVKVATVVNFPSGEAPLEAVLGEVRSAVRLGADEIDLVIAYSEYLDTGEGVRSKELVKRSKEVMEASKSCILKVILETGELKSTSLIRKASLDALKAGADFLKTSTGKTPHGASLEAAREMLQVIKEHGYGGLKVSGGVRTYEEAASYMRLASEIMSEDFLKPETFRFGVSGLLKNLLKQDTGSKSTY